MKLILDTNVFVSGIFFSGPPFMILDAWRHRRVSLVISPERLNEYRGITTMKPRAFVDKYLNKR